MENYREGDWITFCAVWLLDATSKTQEVSAMIEDRITNKKVTLAHGLMPKLDADSVKYILKLKSGWVSKVSKDERVYTRTHKASGTALTYTKVAALWVWDPDFSREELEVAYHLRAIQEFQVLCGGKGTEFMLDVIKLAFNRWPVGIVVRVVRALDVEFTLKKEAADRGDTLCWRYREMPPLERRT